jgi:tRNA dimethylallyltransferase
MTPAISWVAIAGPTASGKTALALALASQHPCEIVSVDSALVYRGMDIGTAKPTPVERAEVPHHLIDLLDPTDSYSAATFVRDAFRAVADIRTRGRLPLLVGGTMLYFKALFEGLDDMPAAQPDLRLAIEAEARREGWPALHARLQAVDPVTAARLAPNDAQRIGRALEVYRATGRPLSAFHQRRPMADDHPPTLPDGSQGLFLSLEPVDRAWLHQRIAQRFDAMLEQGFIAEVARLRSRGDLSLDLPSMRCVGYRQAWEALDRMKAQGHSEMTPADMTQFREKGIAATRQLAKRQLTWLRSMPWRHAQACDHPEAMKTALSAAAQALR